MEQRFFEAISDDQQDKTKKRLADLMTQAAIPEGRKERRERERREAKAARKAKVKA